MTLYEFLWRAFERKGYVMSVPEVEAWTRWMFRGDGPFDMVGANVQGLYGIKFDRKQGAAIVTHCPPPQLEHVYSLSFPREVSL